MFARFFGSVDPQWRTGSGARDVAGRYLAASLAVALCCVFRLQPWWQNYSSFLFIPAVLIGASLFDRGLAIYTTLLTALVAVFFFMGPIFSLRLMPNQIPPLALYLLVCASLSVSFDWLRRITAEPVNRGAITKTHTPALQGARVRLDGIDFWRGFVLCTIFINHMPGNVFENLTFRNVGFSDAAEAFIYLSGVSMALAYGSRFAAGERIAVFKALARRAIKLYGVHIALSLAGIAIFLAGAIVWHAPELLAVHGRDLYISNASLFLVGILSLGHQLGYFNILPLYIVLILWAAMLMWLANIDRYLMVTVSVLVYAASRYGGWNLPSWPVEGTWFLNPLTWQLLLAIGLAAGPLLREGAIPVSRPWVWLCVVFLTMSAFVVTNGFGLVKGLYDAAYEVIDLNKNHLGLGRLLHFLAAVYIVYASGVTSWLRRSLVFKPLALLGRHSLLIFAALSLLDAIGQVLIVTVRASVWLDLALVLGGLGLLYSIALFADAAAKRSRETRAFRAQTPLSLNRPFTRPAAAVP